MAARKTKSAGTAPLTEAVLTGELVERPKKDTATRKREQLEALAGIKDRIFGSAMGVVGDYMRARDVNPDVDPRKPNDDPAFWNLMTELKDEDEVHKVYRIARAGWLPAADCPGFVKVAANMAIGIMKANAAEKGGSHVLNVGRILISQDSIPQFEERDIE
jgi:hypothetical protein